MNSVNARPGKAVKSGRREILGLESRQCRSLLDVRRGWGGYHTARRKWLNGIGLLLFASVWVFLLAAIIRG